MMYRVPLAFFLCAMVCAAGACNPLDAFDAGEQFRCGERMTGDGDVRVCGGIDEVCICHTRSCARRLESTDTQCKPEGGGYIYLSAPFADKDWAGMCVSDEHLPGKVSASETSTPLCEPETDAAVDMPIDAADVDTDAADVDTDAAAP